MTAEQTAIERHIVRQRVQILARLQRALEKPMLLLAFVWLLLFVLEMTRGLSPLAQSLGLAIWIAFGVDFALGLLIAPSRLRYLRRNWLSALALVAPALRIARFARVLRASRLAGASRGARLLRAVSSINRGMKALGKSMRRRGFGYVSSLTVIVTLAGAAGMYGLEPAESGGGGFASYGQALWWTAMIMTTMGSDYWPQTPAARVLCFVLSLYALGVLGYIAASLATFFVGRDAADPNSEMGRSADLGALKEEVARLRDELRQQHRRTAAPPAGGVPG